jgi:hypothetical protein
MSISKLYLISLIGISAVLGGCACDSQGADQDEQVDSTLQLDRVSIDSSLIEGKSLTVDSGNAQPAPQKSQDDPQYPSREWQLKKKLELQKKHPVPTLGPPEIDTAHKHTDRK